MQPGPCVICGATNYLLSMGGPTICPPCDCGDFGIATVQRQAAEIARLTAERDALRALLNEKDYIQCKADYNRGHLSHHNYLAEKERGLGLANEQLTDSAREPVARFDENLGP